MTVEEWGKLLQIHIAVKTPGLLISIALYIRFINAPSLMAIPAHYAANCLK
jgi:hypothetical protein